MGCNGVILALLCLVYIKGCVSEFIITISQTYGEERKNLVMAEIEFYNQGLRIDFGIVSLNDSAFSCMDSNINTICEAIGNKEKIPYFLLKSSFYFDTIMIRAPSDVLYGVIVTIALGSEIIWKTRITEHGNIVVLNVENSTRPQYPMRIIETFPYNGEPVALFHVQYMFDIVDEFVIVESRYTHSGIRKDIMFLEQPEILASFSPYMSKITIALLEEIPSRPSNWPDLSRQKWIPSDVDHFDSYWREHYFRQYAVELIDLNEKALVIIVDADEIPNRDYVAQFRDVTVYNRFNTPVRLKMSLFMYNFQWSSQNKWMHSYIVNTDALRNETDLTYFRVNYMYDFNDVDYVVLNAGWHLSYFLSPADIRRKINSLVHRENDKEEFNHMEYIETCIRNGYDLYKRSKHNLLQFNFESDEVQLPEGWAEFHKHITAMQGVAWEGPPDWFSMHERLIRAP